VKHIFEDIMKKKTVTDLSAAELRGKRVLVRVDFNVPLNEQGGISDDTRIRAALPTINLLREKDARVILCSHLGRPDGKVVEKMRLAPVAHRLSELLGQDVRMTTDCVGTEVVAASQELKSGQVMLLENLRFHAAEERNDPAFAKELAKIADLYVNDAFGTAHRAHASTEGVARILSPAVAGLLIEKELQYLDGVVQNPQRPFAAIIGGSKVSSKIGVIEKLLEVCDVLILGGGMTYTFLKARGMEIGQSIVEMDRLQYARDLEVKAQERGVKLLLPIDLKVADRFAADAQAKIVSCDAIPAGWQGLDIGPQTIGLFGQALSECRTVLWNGPVGVFEFEQFSAGTLSIARTVADLTSKGSCISVIGGGDSVAAVEQAGLADKMSHISTGGGASLELLEGKELPGIAILDSK
jgi:phosphoglycerate kinase